MAQEPFFEHSRWLKDPAPMLRMLRTLEPPSCLKCPLVGLMEFVEIVLRGSLLDYVSSVI